MSGKLKVLMIGPGRKVRGGISAVVDNYYAVGLDKDVDLEYLSTMEEGNKVKKLTVAVKSYVVFCCLLRKYDIIHVHMAAQASFDRKALFVKKAHKAGKRIIIHQHAADFDKYFFEEVDKEKRKRIKEIFAIADKIIVLSEEWATFFGENICNPKKIKVLHNGVIMPEYVKEDYSDHNVLMLGRLSERKGTYDLLKAVPQVLCAVPDVIFFLGGDGDVELCRKIVREGGLEKCVRFMGWVREKDKEKYLKCCSTFILPSYHEGMPMAVLEAMSFGLATVSTNAGGIPQIIEQGKSGIRVKAGNVEAIAETLVDLLKDEEKRRKLGESGRERIRDRFDFKENVNVLKNIYYELKSNI